MKNKLSCLQPPCWGRFLTQRQITESSGSQSPHDSGAAQRKWEGSLTGLRFFHLVDRRLVLPTALPSSGKITVSFLLDLGRPETQILPRTMEKTTGNTDHLSLLRWWPSGDHLPAPLTALVKVFLSSLWQTVPLPSVSSWRYFQSRCLACVQGGTRATQAS